MRVAAVLLCAACLASACVRRVAPDAAPRADASGDAETARRALLDADRAFADATAKRGVEGWTSWFTANGVMLPLNGPLVEGHAAIRDLMRRSLGFPGFRLEWQPLRAEVSRAGDLGYTIGRFEASTLRNGERIVLQRGKYLSVWRKQPDGGWKVEADISNPGEPTSPEGPPR
ncbi:MAG TPA: DUF4440 domain-containing protein [Myxococcaceae bacterium]|nr:DUF4440 domain-containing protein [Myxococcaceae bacterium]